MTAESRETQPINGAAAAPAAKHCYAIRLVRIDLGNGSIVQADLPVGARILHGYVAIETGGLVLARPGEQPTARLVPMLVVLVDPRVTAMERRRFVAITVGEGLASDQELHLVATFASPDGAQVLVLLEERTEAPA